MDLATFLMSDEGVWVKAIQPIFAVLQHDAEQLHDKNDFSPWTIQLGKGGVWYQNGKRFEGTEVSLYRHVLDVSQVAARLFWASWQSGRLPGIPTEDVEQGIQALRVLLAIAFCHDANKFLGHSSHNPTLDEVVEVADRLKISQWVSDDLWGGYTHQRLHVAVSQVENRGQGPSLLGPSVPLLVDKLAEFVHEADALLAHGESPEKLVSTYNERISIWHDRYGLDNAPLRLIMWRDLPPVLHRLQQRIQEKFFEIGQMPFLLWRQGNILLSSIPNNLEIADILSYFRDSISRRQAKVHWNPTNGAVQLSGITSVKHLLNVLQKSPIAGLLTVHVSDLEKVMAYAHFWTSQAEDSLQIVNPSRLSGNSKQVPIIRPSIDGGMPSLYLKALACSALLSPKDNRRRALEWGDAEVSIGLHSNGMDLETLHPLTLQTVIALQTSLVVHDTGLEEWAMMVNGDFPRTEDPDTGPDELVRQLALQQGVVAEPEPTQDTPYQFKERDGVCLLCGHPTHEIINGTMDLLGVKVSAFNNRMGHADSLWSSQGRNYICSACQKRQSLWANTKKDYEAVSKADASGVPLLVSTPIRSWLYQPAQRSGNLQLIRSVDMYSEGWKNALPWNSSMANSLALAWESPVTDILDVIRQMRDLVAYAAYSGESVHVYLASTNLSPDSFVYEPMPDSLRKLLRFKNIQLLNERDAVSRKNLPALVKILHQLWFLIYQSSAGREAFQAIEIFGWWPAAWALWDTLNDTKRNDLRQSARNVIQTLREGYPMVQDEAVEKIADLMSSVQHVSGSSRSDWTFAIRQVLELQEQWMGQGGRDSVAKAIGVELYHFLDRRDAIWHEARKNDVAREACIQFSRDVLDLCYTLEPKSGMLSSSQRRFLVAAYEAVFWEKVNKRWERYRQEKLTNQN